jgi:tRNA A37 methylthiotransferase MiaB
MKLLMITSLKEYSDQVAAIFKEAGIGVYSATDTIGFKGEQEHNLMDSWFGMGEARFDSVCLFSFTEDEKAQQGLQLVKNYNNQHPGDFPIRAFVLPVEDSSH